MTQGQVPVLHRGFLRLQIPEPEEGGRFMKRPSMPMRRKDQQITSTGARAQAKDFATGQLADGARLLEKLLNDEVLPLDAAIQVVIQAMELEVEVREKSLRNPICCKCTSLWNISDRLRAIIGARE